MARNDIPNGWDKIRQNVQETERLMGQKQYNQSMIKARQTLEYMVKLKCDQAGIVESSLDHMIHELYDGQWISKSTAEHYLQILSIGNKAAREGDNSAYNANQAYHVLSQEIYSFTDADKAAPRPRRSQTQSRQAGSRKKQFFYTLDIAHCDSEEEPFHILDQLKRISKIHISNRKGKCYHTPLENGDFSFKEMLPQLLAYGLPLVTEGYDDSRDFHIFTENTAFLKTNGGL